MKKSILNRKQLLNDITKRAKTYFYADLLTVWFSFINANVRSVSDLLDENIFDNPLFLIDNKMINVKSNNWTDAGILKVSDVWNDTTNTFISKSDLEKDHKITISDIIYNQIVSALAFQLKKFLKVKNDCFILKYMNIPNQCISDIGKVKSSHVNAYFSAKLYSTPISKNKWIEFYPFLEGFDWRHIYTLPFRSVLDTYLIVLQYKILH